MTHTPTQITKAKCMACSLHFAAYTYGEEWMPNHCPECGSEGSFIVWKEPSKEFIFQHVPGKAEMYRLTPPLGTSA